MLNRFLNYLTAILSRPPKSDPLPPLVVREKVVVRLDYATFQAFKASLPPAYVGATTTDLEAGYRLGVRHALDKLESGIVLPPQ